MGSFLGHVYPGLGFMFIGLWHLFNTIRNYVTCPWDFRTRTWFPTRFKGRFLKYLELLGIIAGSCLSISLELFIMPAKHQPLAEDWSIPVVHLKNFEHSTISFFFILYATVAIYMETHKLHMAEGMLHVIAALVFSQELFIFHQHSTDHMGLEGHYHWLLQLIIMVGLLSIVLELQLPYSFVASMVRSVSILFQGLWLLHMAFMLWIPACIPEGCEMQHDWDLGHGAVFCLDEKATLRAKALANLQFSWYLAFLLMFTMGMYISMLRFYGENGIYKPVNGVDNKVFEMGEEQGGHSQSSMDLVIDHDEENLGIER
ncbi:hypothetical protein SUGI_0520410 [Cryptomeria japonica]|uniref:uncharacterized protein LOC131034570 n=1 Tax=Cryptomeria japonica TaxID=3369 RepID=UPI002408A202|nr:uncharacterized protein LOC131034570 [Cryptomeria japonica]GLJ26718.1 hypothetical protein SUGI_0520410 [Cryptomeria japonica]